MSVLICCTTQPIYLVLGTYLPKPKRLEGGERLGFWSRVIYR